MLISVLLRMNNNWLFDMSWKDRMGSFCNTRAKHFLFAFVDKLLGSIQFPELPIRSGAEFSPFRVIDGFCLTNVR